MPSIAGSDAAQFATRKSPLLSALDSPPRVCFPYAFLVYRTAYARQCPEHCARGAQARTYGLETSTLYTLVAFRVLIWILVRALGVGHTGSRGTVVVAVS